MNNVHVSEPVRVPGREEPTATLDAVDIRAELAARPGRVPDYEAEDRALALLAREMAENPRNMLQKLVETAIELCNADSAGISLLEGQVFRWEAVAGRFASYRNDTMPRHASPCGVCIDRNGTQLMHLADRCFPALRTEPRVVEALLLPFHIGGIPVGTVWLVAHTSDKKFDREDERIVRVLSQFASAGWQLWKAQAATAEQGRRKDEFLAMLGHELRNPLAALHNALAIVQKIEKRDHRVLGAVAIAARQTRHLSRMVEDLLDISRLSLGTLHVRKAPVALDLVVAHAVERARTQIDRHGHRLSIELPAEPIRLHADAVRLEQMIANLLDNAAKYTLDGGEIWLFVEQAPNKDVTITVRDTGIGIQESRLGSIFELFTQVGDSQERSEGGLGLGLTLVKRLAELHGGTVQAASQGPGTGSAFTVHLPAATDEAPSISEKPLLPNPARSWRILIVDDNEDVAFALSTGLSLDGHEIRTAHDGESALAAARTFKPDVIVLDVGLPGMSGYQVARSLRNDPTLKDVVILALSGYGQAEYYVQSKQAGCDEHLVKPIDIEALEAAIERAISAARQR